MISPSADQNLPNSQNITFDWSDSGDSYTLELTGGPSATSKAGISGSSFNFGTLWPGVYQWRVIAYRNGQSAASGWRNLYIRPNAPNSIGVTTNSMYVLTINWGDSSGIDGYKLYRNGSLLETLGGGTHSYQDTGRSCGTTYSYTVRAFKGTLESDPANANGTTSACPVGPTTPAIIGPADRTVIVYPQNITFDWSDSGDTYTFYFPGGPSSTQYDVSTSSTTLNAPLAGYYEWFVVAHRNGMDSGPSAFTDLYIVPSAPGSVNVVTNSQTAVTVNWTASLGGVDGYYIYQNGTYVAEVGPNTYTYQFNNLNCDTTATYSVSAYYGLGTYNESPKTSKVGSTQPCVIGPSVPTLLSPSSGSSIPNPQSVNFDWSASGDSYIIEITGGPSAGSPSVTTDSLNFGSMWPGIYQWRVKAYRNGQWSAWSDQWTLNVPPGAPGSVSVTTNSISAVTVNWTSSPGGVDGYRIYRNEGLVTTVGGGIYSYQVTGLSCEDTSTYSVMGYKGLLDSASKSANGTTAECPKTVRVLSAFTTDENGTATSLEVSPKAMEGDMQASAIKTNFNMGDGIQLFMEAENQYSTAQTAYFEWIVFDPALREIPELEWRGNLSTASGTTLWLLPTTIPAEVLTGEYTFIAAITFNGEQTWAYYDFNVTGIQSVEAIKVYTTDELGVAGLDTKLASGKVNHAQIELDDNVSSNSIKTTFNAGDPIQLYIDYYNNVGEGEIASYEWSVTDPWDRSVWDLSYSGDLDNYLFDGWWRLNRVIPANAITGTYTYIGSITHNGRTTSKSMTFYINGAVGPSNDGFSTPTTIGSAPYAISQDTWGATVSTTDPTPTCGSGKNSNSVWYRYTAPANGILELGTWGSDFDTVLAVWRGTQGSLTQVACNDDSYGYLESWLEEIPVTAGTIYYIEVMDYGNPGGGNLELYVNFAPSVSNNDFDSPVTISTNPSNLTLNAGGATKASDDPELTACNRLPGEASVWYRYTPAWDGELRLDTKGSNYDTMLAVWTGTRGNLTSLGCNDDVGDVNGEWDQDSILNVQVTAGTTYYIEVSTYAGKVDVNGASAAEAQNKPDLLNSASANNLQEQKAELDKNGGVITGLDDKRNNELSAQFWGGQLKLNLEYIPAPIILSSPTGSIGTNYTPTYTWNSVNSVTWYYLWVNGPSGKILDKWYQASDICNGSTCSVTPGITLGAGAYTWWIQVYNSTGYGPWSSGMDFETAVPPAPGAATLVSPSGSLADYNPTYTWNKVTDSTWYYVSVSGPSSYTFTKWYDASVICGASTCSVTGATPNLAVGAFAWKVQTWNNVGFGPWSAIMSFSTPVPALPSAATLASPTGSIDTGNPTYTWNKVSESTWYYLSVSGPSGYAFTKWYDASVVCGASTCSVAGATPNLAAGAYTWKVQTWNSAGYGPWSAELSFSPPTPPTAATLNSPAGTIADPTPVYTWNDVSTSTWYYLWVNGPSGVVVKQWYSSTEAHCDGSTCWVEPTTSLAGGVHIWWIQTWNSAGYGPWSTAMNFTVSP